MFGCCLTNRLIRDQRGVTAVEFAFLLPVMLLMIVGITEVGRALYQANSVEKSLRMGAVFAARSTIPLTAADKTTVENLVKTGTADGSGDVLVDGWGKAGASLNIDDSLTYNVGPGVDIPVVRLTATVPFSTMLPGIDSILGIGSYKIRKSHEQAYLGN